MSYNGSGTFLVNSAGQPVVTGTVISSTAFNALTADLATGLSTAITKDGQTTTTARIVFAQGVSSTLTTDATSATTGSIITAGGISTQKALWVGTTSNFAGAMTAAAGTFSGAVSVNSLVVNHATFPEIDLNVGASTKVFMYYDNANTRMRFGTNAASSTFEFYSGNAVKALTFDASANASFSGTVTINAATALAINGATPSLTMTDTTWAAGSYFQPGVNSGGTGAGNYFLYNVPTGKSHSWAVNNASKMILGSDGSLLVGTTTNGGWQSNARAEFQGSGSTFSSAGGVALSAYQTGSNVVVVQLRTNVTSSAYMQFNYGSGVTTGSITTNGTTTAYNTTSDYRLKENVQPMTGGLAIVAALKPVTYDWISNGSAGKGFIAHELQDVIPDAVAGEKDALNEDGSIKPQGVDFGKIVPHLVAAIQELTTRLAALESK